MCYAVINIKYANLMFFVKNYDLKGGEARKIEKVSH